MKECNKCGESKVLDEYYYRKSNGRYSTSCKSCTLSQQKAYNAIPKIKARKKATSKIYNSKPEVKAKRQARQKIYRATEEGKEGRKIRSKIYSSKPEVKARNSLWHSLRVQNMPDDYIKALIASTIPIAKKDIPLELIELKRNALKLKRLIKTKKKVTDL